jgi:Na+-transporting methylmalonyl-CoA/oxaloacetate decarboxylase gamma subunit
MGAALAFYSAFSLAPLLIIVTALAGVVFGDAAARAAMVAQLAGVVGAPAAEALKAVLEAEQNRKSGMFATIVGVVTMLVGATTILVELQDDLDYIWKAPKRAGSGLRSMLRARLLSLGMILGIGFLLLVLLLLNGVTGAFQLYSESRFPGSAAAASTVERHFLHQRIHRAVRDVVQVVAQRMQRVEGRLDGCVHHGDPVRGRPLRDRPLSCPQRDCVGLWRRWYAGRAAAVALLLRTSVSVRRRVHLHLCELPRGHSNRPVKPGRP